MTDETYPSADTIAHAILAALKAEGYRITPPRRAKAGLQPGWTPEDVEVVRELYPDTTIPAFVIGDRIGRSVEAVKKMARKIGVARRFANPQAVSAKKEKENPELLKTLQNLEVQPSALTASKLLDRDPLPAPKRAVRGIIVTGAILGDPGFENPREQRGEGSKNGSALS